MDSRLQQQLSSRNSGAVLAIAVIFLLGCARKLQIEIPAAFRGQVVITCAGLTSDRTGILRVDSTGLLTASTCPARQADVVVMRQGDGTPVTTSVMWTTTGDGLVRQISFEVR